MSTQDSSYAPKSPDLSSFYSSSTSDIPQNHNAPGGYLFQAGIGAGLGAGTGAPLRYNQPQPHQYSTYQSSIPSSVPPTSAPAYGSNGSDNTAFSTYPSQGTAGQQGQYFSPRQQTQFAQTNQSPYILQPPNASASYYSSYPEPASPATYHQLQPQLQTQPSQPQTSQPSTVLNQFNPSKPQNTMPPRKIAPAAKQNEVEPSPVKTKFPTARIKRIMQADEEVGKVAQQTPIAVGKALELFMVQLVRKSAEVAREKNSKRITAPMLKQAISSAIEWDFLQDIVAKVGEEKEGGKSSGRTKPDSDSDEEGDVGETKKKGRGGRKKKAPA
ncbi:DNA polymerase epsilon subunit C [Daldinia childiae]|uniref:DNA polymerase epsilon subunit C n=1 Tax=Daldinia childiae TaxID=326645 RepID=UPI0014467135|nr:DNA polymerase epsilon subunit C [Daldinia childiae]KAF3063678.1 DNA polymerase epsilon subunit C [Daldinia childiae]